jgi:hypothetical protein
MTLKEKFIEQSIDIRYQVLEPEKFEQIADDYAIEFAEWIAIRGYKGYSNGWAKLWDKGIYTNEELLEIFKKEKGL